MSEYKIEKGIPIPRGWSKVKYKYPIADLEIGDSFFVLKKEGQTLQQIRGSLSYYAKDIKDKSFTTRAELKPVGIRIWRIK